MEPTTAAMIAKAAIAVGTNKKVWTGLCTRAYLIRPTLIVQGIHFLTYAALE